MMLWMIEWHWLAPSAAPPPTFLARPPATATPRAAAATAVGALSSGSMPLKGLASSHHLTVERTCSVIRCVRGSAADTTSHFPRVAAVVPGYLVRTLLVP